MLFLHPTKAEIAPVLSLAHLSNIMICSVKKSHTKIWVNIVTIIRLYEDLLSVCM